MSALIFTLAALLIIPVIIWELLLWSLKTIATSLFFPLVLLNG